MKSSRSFVLHLFCFGALSISFSPSVLAQSATGHVPSVKRQEWEKEAGGAQVFDVASVKTNKSDEAAGRSNFPMGPGDMYSPNGGLFSATNFPLITYLMFAYKLTSLNDLRGLPPWAMSEKFDIEARAQGNPSKDQMRLMIQSLLADRFKLAMHSESPAKPIYALVLSKPGKLGPQLRQFADDGSCPVTNNFTAAPSAPPATPSSPTSTSGLQLPALPCGGFSGLIASNPGRLRFGAKRVSMALIAKQLPPIAGVDRPAFDHTGLIGTFNFSIEWTPAPAGYLPPDFSPDETGPTFIEALRDQLGLKLVPQTGPVDVLVVDHVEEPSPN